MFKNKSSLYRIYRPKIFDDIAGHVNVVNILKTELKNNSFTHAFLFTGQRGTGKTSIARILAKAVNCKNLVDGNSCENCKSCLAANKNESPDIFEIDAASNNGVDEIRGIKSNVTTMPILGKYKIYIIDEVHMLSKGAFNALLKTLEEPPTHALFILATTEFAKIPATIISRCQTFNFKKIDKKSLESRIELICKKENFEIDSEAKEEIYYLSDGSLRDALNILEQLMIISDGNITINNLKNIFYVASKNEKLNVIKNALSGNAKDLILYFENAENQGMDFETFSLSLIEIIKEIIEYKLTKNENYLNSINIDDLKQFDFNINKLFSLADNLSEAYSKTKGTNVAFNYILINILKSLNLKTNFNNDEIEKDIVSNKSIKEELNQNNFKDVKKIDESDNAIVEVKKEELKIFNEQKISNENSIDIKHDSEKSIIKTYEKLLDLYTNILLKDISNPKIKVSIDEVINMLQGAIKEDRTLVASKIENIFKYDDNGLLINPELAQKFVLLKDVKVSAVSINEILFICDSKIIASKIENELANENFRNELFKVLEKDYIIFAIDNSKWDVVKKEFIYKKNNHILEPRKELNVKNYYLNAITNTLELNPKTKELIDNASSLFGDIEVTINE